MHKLLSLRHFDAEEEDKEEMMIRWEVFADTMMFFFLYDSSANSEMFIHDGHQRCGRSEVFL